MKSDAQLRRDLLAELAWDPAVAPCAVDVIVRDGVATVVGTVDSYAHDCAIRRALCRVAELKAIAPELTVEPPLECRRDDAEIAAMAAETLRWNVCIPSRCVSLSARGGRVMLTGEVEWDYQRRSAENALCGLPGLRGIDNEIVVAHRRQSA